MTEVTITVVEKHNSDYLRELADKGTFIITIPQFKATKAGDLPIFLGWQVVAGRDDPDRIPEYQKKLAMCKDTMLIIKGQKEIPLSEYGRKPKQEDCTPWEFL